MGGNAKTRIKGGPEQIGSATSSSHRGTSCDGSSPVDVKCLGLTGTGSRSIASSALSCVSTAFSSTSSMALSESSGCVTLLCRLALSLPFLWFPGTRLFKKQCSIPTFRRASLLEIFHYSILDCSKLSQVGGLGRILLPFISLPSKISIYSSTVFNTVEPEIQRRATRWRGTRLENIIGKQAE